MADKVTTTNKLVLGLGFTDGDTRTINLDNPRSDVTATDINAVSSTIKSGNILIGDKDKADFSRIESAKIVVNTHTKYDLTSA